MSEHEDVPVGEWIDVPAGKVMAIGTYVDEAGVLRSCSDDSVCAWHEKGCLRKGLTPEDLVYVGGAPWCPDCNQNRIDRERISKLRNLFGTEQS
jgi:hypothetical protein